MFWISSLLTGSANDAFFMALPIVDNFWQSQACIMLTPRMPLYIPCVYVVFMYTSLVGAWRFKLPMVAQVRNFIVIDSALKVYDISCHFTRFWVISLSFAPFCPVLPLLIRFTLFYTVLIHFTRSNPVFPRFTLFYPGLPCFALFWHI